MKVKIYVAAPWEDKELAKEAQAELEAAGYEVTSRWIWLHTDAANNEDIAFKQAQAKHDVTDVYNSHVVLLLNTQRSEGKAVETGLAMAWGKPVILVGDRSNIFHYLPIPKVSTVGAAIELLNEWVSEYNKQTAAPAQAPTDVIEAEFVAEPLEASNEQLEPK